MSTFRRDFIEPPKYRTDAYGRIIPGSIELTGGEQARADADAAYSASVARINASRRDIDTGTAAKAEPVDPVQDRLAAIKDTKSEARLNDAEARANEAYRQSVERLNASRTKQHPAGQPVKL
ncbi:MAG: hypothetical protein U1E34_00905 [Amaricoccus sp.]